MLCVHSLHGLQSCSIPRIRYDFIKEKVLGFTVCSQVLTLGVHKDGTYGKYWNHWADTAHSRLGR